MRTPARAWIVVSLLGATLALGGCGGSQDQGGAAATAGPADTTEAPAAAATDEPAGNAGAGGAAETEILGPNGQHAHQQP